MSSPDRDEQQPEREADAAKDARNRPDEPMEEEEKILERRPDVNMPALLTRDVPGG